MKNASIGQEFSLNAAEIKKSISAESLAKWIADETGENVHKSGSGFRVGKGKGGSISVQDKEDGAVVNDFSNKIKKGDVFDIIQDRRGCDFLDAVRIAKEEILGTMSPTERKQVKKIDDDDIKKSYIDYVKNHFDTLRKGLESDECQKLFDKRGLDRWKICDYKNIGFATEEVKTGIKKLGTIPKNSIVVHNPETNTVKFIEFHPITGKRTGNVRQTGACSWMPWDAISPDGDLWLTEGETSAMALLFSGYHAFPCKPEGKNVDVIKSLASNHRIFLAYDADESGRSYTKKALELVPNAIDVSSLWDGLEDPDPNGYAKKHGAETKLRIDAALQGIIDKAEKDKHEREANKTDDNTEIQYESALKAMAAYKKPVKTKTGTIWEYERGDVEPLCAWLEARGVYGEIFTTDNGWRYEGKPFNGAWLTGEQIAIQRYGNMPAMGASGPKLMKQAAEFVCDKHKRDALTEYIKSLPEWDGVQRIDTFWETYCGTDGSDTNTGISRYMWTAIIGRALATQDKPCKADMCVILKGDQGIGKSSLVRALSLKNEWFSTLSLDMPEDEIKRMLRAAQFVEIGEMGVATKRQREVIKRILTSESISMRKKGSDDHWYFPVRAFFIATSDEADGILNDPNGFRRWLPVEVKGFKPIRRGEKCQYVMDTDGIKRDLVQLYAEALALYTSRINAGLEGVWWDAVPLEGQREATARQTTQDNNADMIYAWFEETHTREATLYRICESAFQMSKERYATDKRFQRELTESLKLKGFKKRQCRGVDGKTWYWFHPDLIQDDSEF